MSPSQVNTDTQSLADLKTALLAFRGSAGERLRGIQQYLQQVYTVFTQAEQGAQENVRHCQEHLHQLQHAHRTAGYRDSDGLLQDAAQRLHQAREHLGTVRHHKHEVEQAIQSYMRQAHRLDQYLAHEVPRAAALLDRKIDTLNKYLHAATSTAPATATQPRFSEGEEPIMSAGDSPPDGWIDRGIQHVRLTDLPYPDGINGPDDFRKVNLETMHAGIVRLQEMLPIIECGEGRSSDYWAQVDQQHGLSYEHGYQRIYEAFYGDSAIKLERIGKQYTIINGRHRVWLAKQMGIETLPARVTDKHIG